MYYECDSFNFLSNSQLLVISPSNTQHFCIDCIPISSKRMIHWWHLYRASLSLILTHTRYCWSCSVGSAGSSICKASKRRVNLGSSRCTSQVKRAAKGSTRTSTKRDLLFVCQQRGDIFYPTLVDKTYPGDYTSRAIRPATTPARWLWTPGSLTPGSHAPLFPLTSVSFTPLWT